MAKLTKLTPVLVERTCEHCGGFVHFKDVHNVGNFFKEKWLYEYECAKCGAVIDSNHSLRLREIVFVDEETKMQYRDFNGFIYACKSKE